MTTDIISCDGFRTLQRAYIEQVDFEQEGSIERDLPGALIPPSLEPASIELAEELNHRG